MNALSVRNLSLHFGEKQVLRAMEFDVPAGEFFVIIGPNGSGKTTLLRAMAGLQKIESGTVRIQQKAISDYPRRDLARVMAVVPQNVPFDFPFTVAETVLMGRSPYLGLLGIERKRDYEIAEQAMEFTDIRHLAGRRLDQLSGGERQRVIIAKAICQEPDIILLDEPTASLDPAHQINVMDLMQRFRRERNTTIVMVSHDLNLAAMYGDRLLLLKDG
ncbi:MAG: ABC transporter ATP-binding protein, partial [Proteobacteria bacterium]|nr:ABC transporter ATP-binding protein [Pseudomonadota bacterium]MBU1710125.1 ABC transporter ATP-binding protein [Pseudomonadota bacterium]